MMSIISALLAAFNLLLYPRMLMLALWPMAASVVAWLGAAIFFWGSLSAWLSGLLQSTFLQRWIEHGIGATFAHYVVGVFLFVLLLAVIYLTAVVITAIFAMPAIVDHVADVYFPALEARRGGTMRESLLNTAVAVAIYCAAWVLSLPFWLTTPLALVLPVMLAAYLNQRLFRYDALAEHATREELAEVVQRARKRLYVLGAITGLLQFVPLLNLVVPIYAGLAFTHLCLGELTHLREEREVQQ